MQCFAFQSLNLHIILVGMLVSILFIRLIANAQLLSKGLNNSSNLNKFV